MSAMPEDEMDDDVTWVAPHEQMDDEMLVKHLNARHLPINGVPSLPEGPWSEHAEPFGMWREWHAATHRLAVPWGVVNEHVHESEPQQ